jgi:anaerobic selenocysteine-containing dehydrogenase
MFFEEGAGMEKLKLSRRTFSKTALIAGVATAFSGQAFSQSALAEDSVSAQGDIQRVRSACRACGKMECGVWVTVENGKVIRVEGDESAFQSEGNCCSKSQASLQAAYHPDRLHYPMKRTTAKGEDPQWVRISWDEAYETIGTKVNEIKASFGGESLFTMSGTSRVWCMGSSACLPILFETPNSSGALQICKGPRMFAGAMTNDMGFFWYEGTGYPKVYVQWGTACEYSNYDDSARTIVSLASQAAAHIVIDPRMTPLGKEADYWLPIRPGTDGALALAWTNIVIQNDLYDSLFVKRWTNAPLLVVEELEPSGGFVLETRGGVDLSTRLLKESDLKEGGSYLRFMAWDSLAGEGDNPLHNNDSTGHLKYFDNDAHVWEGETWEPPRKGREVEAVNPRVSTAFLPDPTEFNPKKDPAIHGEFEVTLKDGRTVKARPVWDYYVDLCAKYSVEEAEKITGVSAQLIEEACLVWATRIDPESGYGNGGLHYQLATDQTGNAVQTERVLSLLSAITGNTDVPGGNRGQTRMLGFTAVIAGPPANIQSRQPPMGLSPFVRNAKMLGGEKFPLNRWFDFWCDVTALWDALTTGEPYAMKGGVCQAGDFMNMSNSSYAAEALKKADFFAVIDLWHTPTAELADILLPAAHWLEVDAPRMSQGSSGAIGATCKCIEPPGEAKYDPEISIGLFKACGVPWSDVPGHEWLTVEEELDRCVACFGKPWAEYKQDFQEQGWFDARKVSFIWHNYRRWETGQLRQHGQFDTMPTDGFPGFYTPTGLTEIWSTVVESYGNPAQILPDFEEPYKSPVTAPDLFKEYPINMTTGSRQPVYFHSEHRQLPWCRELWPVPRVEINPEDAMELGIEQGDWVWIESVNGKVRQTADIYYGIQKGVINANHQWWFPELSAPKHGYDLSCINALMFKDDGDSLCGASTVRALPVKVYKATPENSPNGNPVPCDESGTEIISSADDPRLKKWLPDYVGREQS